MSGDESASAHSYGQQADVLMIPSVATVFLGLLRHWKLLFAWGFLGAVVAVAASFTVDKTYRVSTLVAMAEGDKMGLPSALASSGLGDLAALAGIAPPAGEQRSESLAILQSNVFLEKFLRSHDLLPQLYPRRWDSAEAQWKGGLFRERPTYREAIRKFRKDALTVEEDRKTGLINVGLVWTSIEDAARVGNALIADLNEMMRARRIHETTMRVSALQEQLQNTSSTEVRAALFSLLQQDLKVITIAKTKKDFALVVLDPAQTPDEFDRAAPKRFIWLFMGGFLGGAIGVLFVFGKLSRVSRQQ